MSDVGKWIARDRGAFEPDEVPITVVARSATTRATAPLAESLTATQLFALMEWRWTLPIDGMTD